MNKNTELSLWKVDRVAAIIEMKQKDQFNAKRICFLNFGSMV